MEEVFIINKSFKTYRKIQSQVSALLHVFPSRPADQIGVSGGLFLTPRPDV